MSVRETLPRPSFPDIDTTQRMDLSEVTEDEKTIVVPAEEATTIQPIEETDPVTTRAQERDRRRAERDQALGTRRRVAEEVEPEPVAPIKPKRTTDKFLGSFGLFMLRLVVAAIIGLHGFAKALDLGAVQTMLANTVIPEPVMMSYVLTGAEIAIALALVFGLFTRLAGLGVAAIGIGSLVFVHWITNPFVGNALTGELELLLGGVGLLLICVGAGGWSVDAAFRRRRAAEV